MLRSWGPFRRRLNVFISYSRDDSALVSPIVRLLAALRNDVFIDTASIEVGARWERAVEEAIKSADVVIVFWCTHSSRSRWVRSECDLARSLNKRLMPLLLDETALSGDLQDLHALDFRPLETHKAATSFHSGPFNEREAGALGALVFLGWLAWYGFSAAKEQWMRMPQGARSVTVFALTFVIILWLKRGIGFVKFLFKPFFLEFIPVHRRIAVEVCETLDQIRR